MTGVQRPEEGIGFPVTRDKGDSESPFGCRNQFCVLFRSSISEPSLSSPELGTVNSPFVSTSTLFPLYQGPPLTLTVLRGIQKCHLLLVIELQNK